MNLIAYGIERIITMKQRLNIQLFFIIAMTVGSPLIAHEGEEHGDTTKVKMEEGMFVLTGVTDNFEVVLKYSPTPIGKEMKILIYLSDYATNKPINDASIEFEITGLDTLKPKVEKTDLAGVYHAELTLPDNKPYDVLLTITKRNVVDLIPIKGLQAGLPSRKGQEENLSHDSESSLMGTLILGGIVLLLLGIVAYVSYTLGKRSVSKQSVERSEPLQKKLTPEESEINEHATQ